MVLHSQIVFPFPLVYQWRCASRFTRARASGRSEETYIGALGAKKSTVLRYIRAAPRYRDHGAVRNGKVEVFFWVVKAASVTLRACAHVPAKGSSLEALLGHCRGCTTLLRPYLARARAIPSRHMWAEPVSNHQFCRGFWRKGHRDRYHLLSQGTKIACSLLYMCLA